MSEAPEVFERKLRPCSSDIISPGASEPKTKKRKASTHSEHPAPSIQSLPPETLEQILRWISIADIISFGATCRAFHRLSLSPALWRDIYFRAGGIPSSCLGQPPDWRRGAIMKHTQTVLVQRLSGRPGGQRRGAVTCAVAPSDSLGYRRVLLTRDHQLLWDHQGSVFRLTNPADAATPPRSDLFCQEIAKDLAVDPRSDISYREYIYVLTTTRGPASTPGQSSDCVMVYQQATGDRVAQMTFHPSLKFTQICLVGSGVRRTLLLLSDTGKVYGLAVDETLLLGCVALRGTSTGELVLKKISKSLPRLHVAQIHTSYSAELYLTTKGSVFLDVHSAGMYRRLFGTNGATVPLPLPLPSKVVKCSLGPGHLCLLDDRGRMFMQGSNHHGELGTGDKIDRGQPAPVALGAMMTPVEVICGLNHTLALLQGESGAKEVQGCGCGAGGRLPGCPGGSAVFVRLSVTAPRTARSICSSADSLFLLCCHDTTEPPLCPPPPPYAGPARQETREEKEEREILWGELSQMKLLAPRGPRRLEILQDVVRNRMTLLSPVQRDFLVDALELILDGSDERPAL